jgi:diadenosine tetraphosphate (Ap4A) HIT family hydrolase
MDSCVFCDTPLKKVLFENDYCICFENIVEEVLAGSCLIIPKAHKVTVFDLSPAEWEATKQLLDKLKMHIDATYKPDGYNVGWNCGAVGGQFVFHAHLHVIPRFADEPRAGDGIRHWIMQEENRRPGE